MHMKNESMANKLVYMSFLLAVSDGLSSRQVACLRMTFTTTVERKKNLSLLNLMIQIVSIRFGGNYITAG